ncbi:MAG: GreA/GreB family elongation factor [Myxococcales bacterium]|nr:GreA/GreB family elongation factor [Myxococcales bacterium]
MNKQAVFDAFHAHLAAALADLERESGAALAGTRVDGDHRPENRGERAAVTGQGYLMAGLTARVAELRAHLDTLGVIDPGPRTKVTPGALVSVAEDDGEPTWYAVLPGGQGARLVVDGTPIVVLSPESPLGTSLRGAAEDDSVEVRRGDRVVSLDVVEVV